MNNIKKNLDNSIFEKHITNYIRGMGKILAAVFGFLFFADVVIAVLVYFGLFHFHLQSIKGGPATYWEFLIGQIFLQILIAIPFVFYFCLYKRFGFNGKKNLFCILTISTTFVLAFGHWKNPYISFLFAIPVVIVSPLEPLRNRITFIICEVFVVLYAFFHNIFISAEINYLVAAISCTTVAMFYIVSYKIRSTMNEVFIEMNDYKITQAELNDQIAHDVLTGAFSKSALESDMEHLKDYKSIAFLDIDDFKNVNDEKGHIAGDDYLKLIVLCIKSKKLDIYRYGGDEFVVLSKTLSAKSMKCIFELIKKKICFTSQDLYGYGATISVGIANMNPKKTAEENIQFVDKLMYVSKNKGKDTITVQN